MDKHKAELTKIIGGFKRRKCPCCNDYRTHGNHAKQIGKLSKRIRTILKRELRDTLKEDA